VTARVKAQAGARGGIVLSVATVLILGCLGIAWLVYRDSRDAGGVPERSAAGPKATPSRRHPYVWDDEFSGPRGAAPNPAKWHVLSGPRDGQLQYFLRGSSNVSLDGAGHLEIFARRASYTDRHGVRRRFTSATLETKGLFHTRYGRLRARMKIPQGRGLWPAFWAIGSNIDRVGWPRSGEIDVMENLGKDPFTIFGSVHGPQRRASTGYAITRSNRSVESLATGFHIYGVTWARHKIVFTLDGIAYARVTPASLRAGQRWVFDKPFFMILTLAVGGSWPGPPARSTRFPAKMLVDWVRVYR
jgi:beta-glucanase (GH16 family)